MTHHRIPSIATGLADQSRACRWQTLTLIVAMLVVSVPVGELRAKDYSSLRPTDGLSTDVLAPFAEDFASPSDIGLTAETLMIPNAFGNRLRAWYFPVPGARHTVLICMGNTGNIACMLQYAGIFVSGGFNVMMFDYQGFGQSEGIASVLSLPGDATAAFDFLVNEKRTPAERIGIFGVSLGSILALAVAADRGAGAVATEDIFLPGRFLDSFQRHFRDDPFIQLAITGVRTTVLPRVDPLRTVERLKCPLFLLHGEHDNLLPPSGSLAVAAAASVPTRLWVMPEVGHAPESLEVHELEFRAQLCRFFDDALNGRVADQPVQWSSPQAGDQYIIDVTLPDGHTDGPVQLCVSAPGGSFRFFNLLTERQRELRVNVPFPPRHVSAIVATHVQVSDQGTWQPALSALSRDLQQFRRLSSEFDRKAIRYVRDPENHNPVVRVYYDAGCWDELRATIPNPADVHHRVRPRYARWLSALEVHRASATGVADVSAAELAVQFLPPDPEAYYQLDNAGFELGLIDRDLSQALLWLARRQLEQQAFAAAQKSLEVYLRVRPPDEPMVVTEGHVAAIDESTPPDILPPVPDRRLAATGSKR